MKLECLLRKPQLPKAMVMMIAAVFLLAMPLAVVAAAPPKQGDGEATFQQKCAACHTVGGGKLVGPDLKGVTTERDVDWLTRWISAPDKMLADGDPIATGLLQEFNNVPMPNLGLTEAEVAALIDYLTEQSGGDTAAPVAAPTVAPTPLPAGNPEAGGRLFVGEVRLTNGGPPCISCHSVDTIRGFGGGTLGPNLTHVYNRYGESGLAAALKGLPFPTMQGVFSKKPLTDREAADLRALFANVNRAVQQPVKFSIFIGLGILGAIVFFGISQLVWMKRLNGVRKPLIRRYK